MKRIIKKICLILVFTGLCSCENDESGSNSNETTYESAYQKSDKLVTEPKENLRNSILETTDLLKNVSQDKLVLHEIYLSIQNNVYNDNLITLNDLLNFENSDAYRKANIPDYIRGHFKEVFMKELEENPLKYPNIEYFVNKNNTLSKENIPTNFFDGADITFYAPYLTNDDDVIIDPYDGTTYTPAVIDAYEGLGYVYNPSTEEFEEVITNDDYANNNFTLIIQPNLMIPMEDEISLGGGGGSSPSSNNQYTGNCERLEPTTNNGYIRQVFIGHVRINNKKQYDKWISFTGNGGGSEIRIGRLDSRSHIEIDSTGNISTDTWDNIVSVYFSRKDIRKKRKKWVGSIWHKNWECKGSVHEVLFGVYEEDTEGDITFDGNVKWKNEDLISLNFNIKNRSKDEIIRKWVREKTEFFATNLLDQGGGTWNGMYSFSDRNWAVYDSGTNFSYTMPHRWVYVGNNSAY